MSVGGQGVGKHNSMPGSAKDQVKVMNLNLSSCVIFSSGHLIPGVQALGKWRCGFIQGSGH